MRLKVITVKTGKEMFCFFGKKRLLWACTKKTTKKKQQKAGENSCVFFQI